MIYQLTHFEHDGSTVLELYHKSKTEQEFKNDCNLLIKEYMTSETPITFNNGEVYIERASLSEYDCIQYVKKHCHRFGYRLLTPNDVIKYNIDCDMYHCIPPKFPGNEGEEYLHMEALRKIKEKFPKDVADAIIQRGIEYKKELDEYDN